MKATAIRRVIHRAAAILFLFSASIVAQESRPSVVDRDWKLSIVLPDGFSDLKKDSLSFKAESAPTSQPMVRYLFGRKDGVRGEVSVLPWSIVRRRSPSIFHSLEVVADFVARATDAKIVQRSRGWRKEQPFIRWVMRNEASSAAEAGSFALQLTASIDDVLLVGVTVPDGKEITPNDVAAVLSCADRTEPPVAAKFTVYFRNYTFDHPVGWLIEDQTPLLSMRSPDGKERIALGFEPVLGQKNSDADTDLASLRRFAGERAALRETFAVYRPAEATFTSSTYRFSEIAFSTSPLDQPAKDARILRYYPTEGGRIVLSAVFPKTAENTVPKAVAAILDGAEHLDLPTSRPESSPTTDGADSRPTNESQK